MKPKFLVVRLYSTCTPSIVETVDIEADAKALCEIYSRKDHDYKYVVYKAL